MKTSLKLAIKVLGRRKFFTFISLFGISMTLVVLMVATAVLDSLFAAHAPESRFDRVLCVYRITNSGKGETESSEPGLGFLERFVKPLHNIEAFGVFTNQQTMGIYHGSERIDAVVRRTDAGYWRILDFRFLDGRPYSAQDDESGALVAVISDSLREKLFGSAPAVGQSFEVDGRRFKVVGVVPKPSLTRIAAYGDVWLPIGSMEDAGLRQQMMGGANGLVLAHKRSDFASIRAEFKERMRDYPLDRKRFTEVRTGLDTPFEAFARIATWNRQDNRGPVIVMTLLAVAAILFMTLPALNLVTLNLTRILERSSEIGVRKAFGATRRALVWQFVAENVVLTLIGGVVGFILAVSVLAAVTHSDVVPNARFEVNLNVFAWGMAIAVLFGVFSGVYPAWRMSRLDPVDALRGGAK
jgi:putative ABC transport system permease protein